MLSTEAIILVPMFWITYVISAFLILTIISYIKQKPEAKKSTFDIATIHLAWYQFISTISFTTIRLIIRGDGTGCAGCAVTHPVFRLKQLRQPFSRNKNFQNRLKIDRVRGKNVNCASTFQQLPPALKLNLILLNKLM